MYQSELLFVTIGTYKVGEINGSEDTHVFVGISLDLGRNCMWCVMLSGTRTLRFIQGV